MLDFPEVFPDQPELNQRLREKIMALEGEHGIVPVYVERRAYLNSSRYDRMDVAFYYYSPVVVEGVDIRKVSGMKVGSGFTLLESIASFQMALHHLSRQEAPICEPLKEKISTPVNNFHTAD